MNSAVYTVGRRNPAILFYLVTLKDFLEYREMKVGFDDGSCYS